jgi:Arc/MetJ-type ribon-helix-helix transcriptional regulator
MKLSVSLPDEDVEFLDSSVRADQYPSRSAALHEAVRELRAKIVAASLVADYADAWDEWVTSGEEAAWHAAAGDGITPE